MGPPRLLVLRPGAIGDTILAFPALQALRRTYPDADLEAVGNRAVLALAADALQIDRVTGFDSGELLPLFRPEPTSAPADVREGRRDVARNVAATFPNTSCRDLAIPPRYRDLDLAVLWMDEAGQVVEANLRRGGARRILRAPSRPAGPDVHVADYLVQALQPVGLAGGPMEPVRLEPRLNDQLAIDRWLDSQEPGGAGRRPLVALHPGAGAHWKRWPAEQFARLADGLAAELGATVVLVEGPADRSAVAAVLAARVRPGPVASNLALAELLALLARSHLVISNDSGVGHLAAAAGAPTVALFGPTLATVWKPRGRRAVALDAGQGCARPCLGGGVPCRCLASLPVEAVMAASRQVIDLPDRVPPLAADHTSESQ